MCKNVLFDTFSHEKKIIRRKKITYLKKSFLKKGTIKFT